MACNTAGQKARTHVQVLISFSTAVALRASGTRSSRSAASWARRVSGAMAVLSGPKMVVAGAVGVSSPFSFSLLGRRERRAAAWVKTPMTEETGKFDSRGGGGARAVGLVARVGLEEGNECLDLRYTTDIWIIRNEEEGKMM